MNPVAPDRASIEAVRALARVSRMLERASGELSLAQYRVLAAIASGDERASRIAARLALGKPTVSATVESLDHRGLLTRTGVVDDQRAATLRVTAEGRAVLDRVEAAMTERLAALVARTPDGPDLVRCLGRLGPAIDEVMANHPITAARA